MLNVRSCFNNLWRRARPVGLASSRNPAAPSRHPASLGEAAGVGEPKSGSFQGGELSVLWWPPPWGIRSQAFTLLYGMSHSLNLLVDSFTALFVPAAFPYAHRQRKGGAVLLASTRAWHLAPQGLSKLCD